MNLRLRRFIFYWLLLLNLMLPAIAVSQSVGQKEFRGIWICTINNIDWPSAPGLPVDQQKRELRDLIDRIGQFHLNTVFFQVRPAADAFYSSAFEPWSYFLTGKQGKATQPLFDPLAYAIELCHSRGIELHAWFNPFRVRNQGYYELAKNSFAAKYPQYQHNYDDKRFFDPGFPQVRTHIIKVILEVIRNYDIDGVLLDDYFYPYPVKGKSFPDSKTFAKFGKEYYPKRLKDWRRNNINSFISQLHDSMKSVKPSVRLGISPFGVWRSKVDDPNGSSLLKGTTSYDDLYADVYKWLSSNWIDYVVPQLYWEQGNRYGDFNELAKWWNEHSCGKPLYIGQALYRSTGSGPRWSNPTEISDQIKLLRNYENIKGFAFFSASHLSKLPEIENKELIAQLVPRIRDSADNKISLTNNTISSAFPELITDIKSFDSIVDLSKKKQHGRMTLPIDFKIKKEHRNWVIKYRSLDSSKVVGQKYILLSYKRGKDQGFLRKVHYLDVQDTLLISRKDKYNPRKDAYALVSVNESGGGRVMSDLIRIKRKRMVYW